MRRRMTLAALTLGATALAGCGYDAAALSRAPQTAGYGYSATSDAFRGHVVTRPDGSTYYLRPSPFVNPRVGGDLDAARR